MGAQQRRRRSEKPRDVDPTKRSILHLRRIQTRPDPPDLVGPRKLIRSRSHAYTRISEQQATHPPQQIVVTAKFGADRMALTRENVPAARLPDPDLSGHNAPSGSTRRSRDLPISPALRAGQALALKRLVSEHLDGDLDVHVTDNRTVMLSVKRDARHRRYRLRVHHIFVHAPTPIIESLARYVALNDRTASKEIGRFIEQNDQQVGDQNRVRSTQPRTAGKCYDLAKLFDELNRDYFDGNVGAHITWGRNAAQNRARNTIRLGSFSVEENLIRIHPGLDQHWVPLHYLRWVVYHEMLHAVHPVTVCKGRRRFHTPAFLDDERKFDQLEWAQRWERRNLAALLCV